MYGGHPELGNLHRNDLATGSLTYSAWASRRPRAAITTERDQRRRTSTFTTTPKSQQLPTVSIYQQNLCSASTSDTVDGGRRHPNDRCVHRQQSRRTASNWRVWYDGVGYQPVETTNAHLHAACWESISTATTPSARRASRCSGSFPGSATQAANAASYAKTIGGTPGHDLAAGWREVRVPRRQRRQHPRHPRRRHLAVLPRLRLHRHPQRGHRPPRSPAWRPETTSSAPITSTPSPAARSASRREPPPPRPTPSRPGSAAW